MYVCYMYVCMLDNNDGVYMRGPSGLGRSLEHTAGHKQQEQQEQQLRGPLPPAG